MVMQLDLGSLPPIRRQYDALRLNLYRMAGYSYGSPVGIDIRGRAPSLPSELRSLEVQHCYVEFSSRSYSGPLNYLHVTKARSSTVFREQRCVVSRDARRPGSDLKVEDDFC